MTEENKKRFHKFQNWQTEIAEELKDKTETFQDFQDHQAQERIPHSKGNFAGKESTE
jgi:hypothetical protein